MSQSLKQQTVTGVKWSAIERIANQSVHFVVNVIMARLLCPADYGLVGMVAVFLSLSEVFVNSGFSQALIRKIDRTESDNCTAFYFNIIISWLCYGILYVAAPYISAFYNQPQLVSITRVISLLIPIRSLGIVQKALLSVKMDFRTQSRASVIGSMISGIVGVTLAYSGFGVWSIVIQRIAGLSTTVILLWIVAKWRPTKPFSWASFKDLFGFGSKLLLTGIVKAIYANIRKLVIGKFYSPAELGFYSKASNFSSSPTQSLTTILQRVVYPVLCKLQQNGNRMNAAYRQFIRLAAFLNFPLMAGMAGISQAFVLVLLGDKWAFTGELLLFSAFSRILEPIHAINLNPLQALGRSDLFLRLEIIKKILGLTILAITVQFGIKAIIIGSIFSSVIGLFINSYYNKRLIGLGLLEQLKDVAPSFLLAMSMFSIIMVWNYFVENIYVELIGGILIGATFYVGCAYFFKFDELFQLVDLTKNYLFKRHE